MSEREVRTVEHVSWVGAMAEAREEGFDYFDFLSVRQLESGSFIISVHVVNPSSVSIADEPLASRLIESQWDDVDRVGGHEAIASIAGIYPGALWHEREAAELYGINFDHEPEDRVHPFVSDVPALRRDFALSERVDSQWPGAHEPGLDEDHPRRKRRRAVPGNRVEWSGDFE